MHKRVNIATTWLRSCSNCHMKMFDLHEELLNFQIGDCFIGIDEADVVDIGIVEGAVANKENERILKKFRAKSKVLVAVGTCACFGVDVQNMPQQEEYNRNSRDQHFLLDRHSQARPLNHIVAVDYFVPGCPPLMETLKETITSLLKGRKPKPKTKTRQNICTDCKRKRPESFSSRGLYSLSPFYAALQTQKLDPEVCFLEQGVLCVGSTTIGGCGARCLKGNIPCWGCMGPVSELHEAGLYGSDLHEVKLNELELHGAGLRASELHGLKLNELELNEVELNERKINELELNELELGELELNKLELNENKILKKPTINKLSKENTLSEDSKKLPPSNFKRDRVSEAAGHFSPSIAAELAIGNQDILI